MQHGFLTTFLYLQLTGAQINKRMLPVFMGTSPVIGEITRYKHVRAIEYI